jgi:hypothetical protein
MAKRKKLFAAVKKCTACLKPKRVVPEIREIAARIIMITPMIPLAQAASLNSFIRDVLVNY